MDSDHPDLVPRSEAVETVLNLRVDRLAGQSSETVPVDELVGRTLATDVVAETDSPAQSHATMDGFALDATDGYPLDLVEREVFPEDHPGSITSGQAVRIATGAPVPEGANAVLKREEATVDDGELTGTTLEPGTYVYERGTNVTAGTTLFTEGERLSPKDAILLRDLGPESIAVHERFSVGILATGTEIHEGQHTDLDSPMLAGLVRSWGHEATYEGSVPDDADRVRDRITDLASEHDVVVTTGGTSVGHKDHVITSLADIGDILFHRVRIRPGKPIAAAHFPDHDAVAFAIPGKPIGAYVISSLVMRPFFTDDDGPLPTVPASLSCDLDVGATGFEYVVPVTLDDGTAVPLGHRTSDLPIYDDVYDPSVLSSATRASRADGFFITDSGLDAGASVDVIPHQVLE